MLKIKLKKESNFFHIYSSNVGRLYQMIMKTCQKLESCANCELKFLCSIEYMPSLNGCERLKLIGPNPVIQVMPTPIEYLSSSTDGSKQLN